jgi:membrane associated rhomboid family serine protease
MADQHVSEQARPEREPAFNIPWPVGALVGALIVTHLLRVVVGGDPDRFALTSDGLHAGHLAGIITYQFVHGSWAHVLMNSAFCLAFGAPVARYLGVGWRGGGLFLLFFLVCGAVAALAFAAVADGVGLGGATPGPWAILGASGSASGLMAAAVRLMVGRGHPGPILSRGAMTMTISWLGLNLVLGVSGLTPGAAGIPVAWQAHVFGYLCGLVLIGAFGRLAGAGRDRANVL